VGGSKVEGIRVVVLLLVIFDLRVREAKKQRRGTFLREVRSNNEHEGAGITEDPDGPFTWYLICGWPENGLDCPNLSNRWMGYIVTDLVKAPARESDCKS
jgi:hypothetical protein